MTDFLGKRSTLAIRFKDGNGQRARKHPVIGNKRRNVQPVKTAAGLDEGLPLRGTASTEL